MVSQRIGMANIRYALYPGCAAKGATPELYQSTMAILGRLGGHSLIRRLLVGATGSAPRTSGRWQGLASALNRHTIEGGLSKLSSDDRRLITLAYQEGRTNREIAMILGISLSTVARRLSAALERLDRYVHRAGTWVSTIQKTPIRWRR